MRYTWKKAAAVFMALVMVLSLPGAYVQAADTVLSGEKTARGTTVTEGDWTYTVTNGEAEAVRYTGSDTEVKIPAVLGGYPVTSLYYYLLYGCDEVTSVEIPASVTKVGGWTFEYGDSLAEITVAAESTAFSAADGVLFNKDRTELVRYPKAKTGSSYRVPDTVTKIRQFAFDSCNNLTSIMVPDSVTSIGDQAIYECSNLSSVSLGNGLEKINTMFICMCEKITSLHIPAGVREIGTNNILLKGCPLETITIDSGNPYFTVVDDVLFTKDMRSLLWYPAEKKDTVYTVPSGVESVNNFSGNHYLQKVVLPEGVTTVGMEIFDNCTSLTEVTLPSTLQDISYGAFWGCGITAPMEIPESVAYIGDYAFQCGTESVTIRNKDCRINNSSSVFRTTTVLYGYGGSTTEKYARNFGRTFVNLETGERTAYTCDNAGLVGMLPSTEVHFGEPTWHAGECTILHESDTSRAEYVELKNVTEELIKDCTTDYDRVETISNWVTERMTYVLGDIAGNTMESVYNIYKNPRGNCMCYTQLTAYMLYLAGFSVVDVTSSDHEWCLAWVDGSWVTVDSTNGRVGTAYNDCDDIVKMSFSMDGMSYTINSFEGVYLQCISYTLAGCKDVREITIPAFVEAVDGDAFFHASSALVVHGTRGTYGEEYMKNKYACFAYEGDTFTAHKEHDRKAAVLADGSSGSVCEYCGEIVRGTESGNTGGGTGAGNTGGNTGGGTDAGNTGGNNGGGTGAGNNGTGTKGGNGSAAVQGPAAGTRLLKGYVIYKVTKAGDTVQYVKTAAKGKSVTIPAKVTINGITYKVTSIAANALKGDSAITKVTIGKNVTSIGKKAFYGCKKLKNIVIKTTKLTAKSVGKNAFKGIAAKAVVKVPKAKQKAYKALLKKRGIRSGAKFK